jgi:hypothetical protein
MALPTSLSYLVERKLPIDFGSTDSNSGIYTFSILNFLPEGPGGADISWYVATGTRSFFNSNGIDNTFLFGL